MSPCPPVWLSSLTQICRRGPGASPSATARRAPASAPPASRRCVTPASSVTRRLRAASKTPYVTGARNSSDSFIVDIATWAWQSNTPGMSQRPPKS